jgi:hypothetical protein
MSSIPTGDGGICPATKSMIPNSPAELKTNVPLRQRATRYDTGEIVRIKVAELI